MVVQIQVSDDTWTRLKNLKKRPGQTFDEIIKVALEDYVEDNGDDRW